MADAGDALALLGRGGGEQSARAAEENVFPAPGAHTVEQMPGEHHGGAAAAGAAAVHVLTLQIVDQGAAVGQVVQVHAVLVEQVEQDLAAQLAQVSGDDQVVLRGPASRVLEVGLDGLIGRGG